MGDAMRVAVLGTGFIGRVHARAARLAGGTLAVVAASTADRSVAAAGELGAERGAATWEEAVRGDDVDVVHVCTPNHLHVPQALAALEAGKHVVCEKPLGVDLASARRLADAAAASGLVLAVPFVYRYHPMVREARDRIARGDAGAIRLIHGSYLQDWLAFPSDDNWRVDVASGGASRAFADIGSHWCDLAEFVTGHRVSELVAVTSTFVGERTSGDHRATFGGPAAGGAARPVDTEDAATVLFRTEAGAVGSVVVSQVSPGRKNRLWLEVDGELAALAFDQEQPEALWRGARDGSTLLVRDPVTLGAAAARYATLPAGHAQGYHDCFDLFVAEAYDAVRSGSAAEGLPVAGDGVRAATVVDAVLESAATGRWVEVGAR